MSWSRQWLWLARIGAILLVGSCWAPCSAEAGARHLSIQDIAGRRVLVLGDSITQNGRWVSFLEYFLTKAAPQTLPEIVSVGLASETVSGVSEEGHAGGAFGRPWLHDRLGRALELARPDVVIACYGMNDGGYLPFSVKRLERFQRGIVRLASEARHAGAQVILITPPVFDYSKARGAADPDYDKTLSRFSELLVKSPPNGTLAVIDMHTAMSRELERRKQADRRFYFAGDGVHPNELGHLFMAATVLNHLGVPMPLHTLDAVLGETSSDVVFKLIDERRSVLSSAWLAHIGYTREKTVPTGSGNLEAAQAAAKQLRERIQQELTASGSTIGR